MSEQADKDLERLRYLMEGAWQRFEAKYREYDGQFRFMGIIGQVSDIVRRNTKLKNHFIDGKPLKFEQADEIFMDLFGNALLGLLLMEESRGGPHGHPVTPPLGAPMSAFTKPQPGNYTVAAGYVDLEHPIGPQESAGAPQVAPHVPNHVHPAPDQHRLSEGLDPDTPQMRCLRIDQHDHHLWDATSVADHFAGASSTVAYCPGRAL